MVADCDEAELVALAASERVVGMASQKLLPLVGERARHQLAAYERRDAFNHLFWLGLLGKLGRALDEAGVEWLVLKGPALAELSYRPVSRGYSDLDILVSPRHFTRALAALGTAGAVVADQDWHQLVESGKGELNVAVSGRPTIDLHWHLVFHRSARQCFAIQTEDLLARRQRVQLGPITTWALDPVDFATHIALHASFQGAQRLHRLLDIERTVTNQPPDWDLLVRRCREWKVSLPVAALLNSAKETLGAPVPRGVVDHLAEGRAARILVSQLSGWVPSGRIPGGRSVRTGLSRSLRNNVLTTTIEFAAETWRTLGRLTGRGDNRSADEPPAFAPDGNEAGLSRFCQMVDAADRYGHLDRQQLRRISSPAWLT